MKLSVVIVNYNVRYFVEQCLRSVLRAMEGIEGEVYVVDNHSHDGSMDYLKPRFPQVRFIEANHNLGFARANNLAVRQSSGQYVLLLNPDTYVGEDVFREALRFMDSHPQAGAAGVRMHNSDGSLAPESRRALPTPSVSFLKMLGVSDRYYMSHLSWDQPARIDIVSGAFCLLRREALDRVGLLDEDYFMYGEDIDLSYRLLKGGYENWFLPLDILHYKGESTQKSSFRYVHVFYQAMLIFFRKHYGHLSLLITLPIKLAIFARAGMALAGTVWRNIRKSMGFVELPAMRFSYEFKGSAGMAAECHELAKRKGLAEQKADGTPHCVVYDTDEWTFAQMLGDISRLDGQDACIGTYSRQTKVLITQKEIFL